jgi:PPOX class probable F420-dependent enzyme
MDLETSEIRMLVPTWPDSSHIQMLRHCLGASLAVCFKCVSCSSEARDGSCRGSVVTPVWFVTYEGRLWLWTDAASGKVKRIRNSTSCAVAQCTMSGRITGAALPGRAWLVPADHCEARVQSMLRAKYPIQKRALDIYSRLRRRGAPAPASAYVEIAVTGRADAVIQGVGEGSR